MLKDNLKTLRKEKGLSQEELSIKLNVVRQTISKWEQGLSIPDAEMLVTISEVFDTPVSTLLGENISEDKPDNLKTIAEKLEVINLQLIERRENKRRFWHWFFIILSIVLLLIFTGIILLSNDYMNWDFNTEMGVLRVIIHGFIWIFVRIAPFLFIGSIIGIYLTKKRN
jgi:putative transcriptional regulator